MKHMLVGMLLVGSLILAVKALAQSAVPSAGPSGSSASPNLSSGPVIQTVTAPAAPVNPSRRFACRAAAQKYQGQDRADQMQLCIAQARLDCLKQAIDQKVVGPQRRDFVQNCVGE